MPVVHNCTVVKHRHLVKGAGFKDEVVAYGRNGFQFAKSQASNAVKQMVPVATEALSNAASNGIHKLADLAANTVSDQSTKLINSVGNRITTKLGGGSKPNRDVILREIQKKLLKSKRN